MTESKTPKLNPTEWVKIDLTDTRAFSPKCLEMIRRATEPKDETK